jgi:hypothetical protein
VLNDEVVDIIVLHAGIDEIGKVVEKGLAGNSGLATNGAAAGTESVLRSEQLKVQEGNPEDGVDDQREGVIGCLKWSRIAYTGGYWKSKSFTRSTGP